MTCLKTKYTSLWICVVSGHSVNVSLGESNWSEWTNSVLKNRPYNNEVIRRWDLGLVSSERPEKREIDLATPGLVV